MMFIRNVLTICAAIVAFSLPAPVTFAQTTLASPAQVQNALATLDRVVHHTQRLITAKNYSRLPHENSEFREGAEALARAISTEPADFKEKVTPLLKRAEGDSQSMAAAAAAQDDAKLAETHAALASSVKAVVAAFPDDVQPKRPTP